MSLLFSAHRRLLNPEPNSLSLSLSLCVCVCVNACVCCGYFCLCSVTMAELKEAIKKQTTLDLADDVIDLPVMKELGTFTVTANLHPEVKQDFTVTVEKA